MARKNGQESGERELEIAKEISIIINGCLVFLDAEPYAHDVNMWTTTLERTALRYKTTSLHRVRTGYLGVNVPVRKHENLPARGRAFDVDCDAR